MATVETAPDRESIKRPKVEPLQNGDCLWASEFLRRYEAMPDVKKAELVDGIVYMGSPVSLQHGAAGALILQWLAEYVLHTPDTQAVGNVTVRLDADNVVQPDALLRLLPEFGGATNSDEKDYIVGVPELIVEIAASTAALDLHGKLRAYRRAGVREYVVWRTMDQRLDWFVLEQDQYRPQQISAPALLRSAQFTGLALDLEALLAQNAGKVLTTLRSALQEPAHATFVQTVAARKRS